MDYFAIFRAGIERPVIAKTFDTQAEGDAWLADMLARQKTKHHNAFKCRLLRSVLSVERVTSAPVEYDGHGTRTAAVLGKGHSGTTWRKVEIHEQHLQWQLMRNGSGLHPTLTMEDWERGKENLLIMPGVG